MSFFLVGVWKKRGGREIKKSFSAHRLHGAFGVDDSRKDGICCCKRAGVHAQKFGIYFASTPSKAVTSLDAIIDGVCVCKSNLLYRVHATKEACILYFYFIIINCCCFFSFLFQNVRNEIVFSQIIKQNIFFFYSQVQNKLCTFKWVTLLCFFFVFF